MNNNPHNPTPGSADAQLQAELDALLDAQLDALLAEEAATVQAPEALEAKVLALTDPRLLSLLDEALAPAQAPDQLTQRILAATLPSASPAVVQVVTQRAVLARIEPTTWRYAAAAAIVVASGVGLWWTGQQGDIDSERINFTPNAIAQDLPDLTDTNEARELFASATQSFEVKIQNVADRLDAYAIDRDTIWSDMDGYEQFLSDFESTDPAPTPAT